MSTHISYLDILVRKFNRYVPSTNNAAGGFVLSATLLLSSFAYAQGWQPSAQESDAFVEAYSFPTLKAVLNTILSLKEESGEISPETAACARTKISLTGLLVAARPIVARTFSNGDNLREATSFYLSPTGFKMKEFGAKTLGDYLRSQAKKLPPPPRSALPENFTQKDLLAANRFAESPAGKDFNRFVAEGLPRLRTDNALREAIRDCNEHSVSK